MTRLVSGLVHIGRSLLRYWGLSLLNIAGLAIGFAAALIIGLYVRDELTYDHFIPNAEHVSLLTAAYGAPDKPLVNSDQIPAGLARWLRSDAPEVAEVARLHNAELPLRSERFETLEHFYWADPNIFKLLRVRALHGNLDTALRDYDTIVISRKKARLYFGREDVVGQMLVLNGDIRLKVTAVIDDIPNNTHLDRDIFVSGMGGYSMLAALDFYPEWLWASSYTYVSLKPGARLSQQRIDQIARQNWTGNFVRPARFSLVPLPELHFQPEADSQMKPRGHRDTIIAMCGVAVLILVLAAANIAGLMWAQIRERQKEMEVRHALGASSLDLFLQILSEGVVVNVLSLGLALALAERFLPYVNTHLGLQLDVWASPAFLILTSAGLILVGTAGTLFPALRLSSISPTREQYLKLHTGEATNPGQMAWIMAQSCLLIVLLVSSQTVLSQWNFAMDKALNFDARRVLLVSVSDGKGQDARFKSDILRVPGVEGAAHSRFIPVYQNIRPGLFTGRDGRTVQFTRESVDQDFFRLYGVSLLAGRGFTSIDRSNSHPDEVIIDTSALRAFGFATPQQAVGRAVTYHADGQSVTSRIIGVVEPIRTATVREPLVPMMFDSKSMFFSVLSVRIARDNQTRTLSAIDALWKREAPDAGPVQRRFFSDYLKDQYHDMLQQWRVFGMLSIIGICLNIIGLSGLSIYLARARMREFAIRSALGAQLIDLIRLRLAPFVKPLIVANLVAGALSWGLMTLWLSAFSARVSLDPLVFISSGAAAVLIMLITLTIHIFLSSPARSSQPLRAD